MPIEQLPNYIKVTTPEQAKPLPEKEFGVGEVFGIGMLILIIGIVIFCKFKKPSSREEEDYLRIKQRMTKKGFGHIFKN